MKYLITGGAGFIGSAVIRQLIKNTKHQVCNVDALTYAGNLSTLTQVADAPRYCFEHANICDGPRMAQIINQFEPDVLMHFAAESHVDRSIEGPAAFIQTNIVGTYNLLDSAYQYWTKLDAARKKTFRFQHISTDEVFGSLGAEGLFTESTPYAPNSPYSASKAASDHLVRAWGETYGLPVITTNCSNNYGPYQFPEKLIPLMIINGLAGKALPIYGKGDNIRDWLHVDDHARGLIMISQQAQAGSTYNLGGDAERQNIEVVHAICDTLDQLAPIDTSRRGLIDFVTDRPGHDARYAIDCTKLKTDLGWQASVTFEEGLRQTVQWYLDNKPWWQAIQSGKYDGTRLGIEHKSISS